MRKVFFDKFGTQKKNCILGTPLFSSIEKFEKMEDESKPNFNEFKSDVFSLGMSYLVAYYRFNYL